MSVREQMQAVGHAVARELPPGYGFFVLCFPFATRPAPVDFVSNAQPADVVAAMKDFIDRNPMQAIGRN